MELVMAAKRFFLVLLLLACLPACAHAWKSEAWKLYFSEPQGWEERYINNTTVAFMAPGGGGLIMISSKPSVGDGYQTGVDLEITKENVDRVRQRIIDAAKNSGMAQIDSVKDITINGHTMIRISMTVPEEKLCLTSVTSVYGKNMYVFTLKTAESKHRELLPYFEKALQSIIFY